MTMNWPGSSGGDDAYDYDEPHSYDEYDQYGQSGGYGSGEQRRGGAFEEFRRQMEDMLGGTRPTGPTILTGRRRSEAAPPHEPDMNQTGLALVAAASYWALPFALRGRRKRRLARQRARRQANDTTQT